MLEKTGVAAALGHSLFSGGTEGLLLAFGAWTSRWIGIALDQDYWYAMLPFAVSIMAAGAYWLERADEHDGVQ